MDDRQRLERMIRAALAATWRDREIGDVDLDQAATLAADIATVHLDRLQQPRLTPTTEGLEIRYRVVIPWDKLEATTLSARENLK